MTGANSTTRFYFLTASTSFTTDAQLVLIVKVKLSRLPASSTPSITSFGLGSLWWEWV